MIRNRWIQFGLLLVPLLSVAGFAYYLQEVRGSCLSREWFILIVGIVLGIALQRSRFCFFCVLRDYFEKRDSRGVLGIVAALAVGSVGYLVVFGIFVPDPQAGFLPPNAHIGPVTWVLVLGAILFGWGMALSGSCISAHLYRLGEGSVLSPIALLGAFVGFWLGFRVWNPLYLNVLSEGEVIWLPQQIGYGWALLLQIVVLLGLFFFLLRRLPPQTSGVPVRWSFREVNRRVWVERWPTWVGGLIIGALGMVAYLRFRPLGVTSQLGSLSRSTGDQLGILPDKLEGLDGFAGCSTTLQSHWLNDNGILVFGLVAGAWFVGVLSREFEIEKKHILDYLAAGIGGILLGLGGMISLGCTVGTLLSGVSALALSGWVFAIFLVVGVWSGLYIRKNLFFWHK